MASTTLRPALAWGEVPTSLTFVVQVSVRGAFTYTPLYPEYCIVPRSDVVRRWAVIKKNLHTVQRLTLRIARAYSTGVATMVLMGVLSAEYVAHTQD